MTDENVEAGRRDPAEPDLLRLLAGDEEILKRLRSGESLRVATPLRYPGHHGPIVVYLTPGPGDGDTEGSVPVRISDGGDLIKSLDEQGMELAVDLVMSKTVFHAVRQVDGAGIAGGEVFLGSTVKALPLDVWRLLQLIAELIGLRHSKYKDALIRLSHGQ